MNRRIIEIVVSPKGETIIRTKGYAGPDCLQASKFLEQALGVVAHDHKTAEYFQAESMQLRVEQ